MIEKLDASVPRDSDPAPGVPGNRSAEQFRGEDRLTYNAEALTVPATSKTNLEVRAKINEIIDIVNAIGNIRIK